MFFNAFDEEIWVRSDKSIAYNYHASVKYMIILPPDIPPSSSGSSDGSMSVITVPSAIYCSSAISADSLVGTGTLYVISMVLRAAATNM